MRARQVSPPADSPLHRAAQSVSVRESVTESVYQPLSPPSPFPAWTGLIATRLPSPLAPRPPSPAWTGLIARSPPNPTSDILFAHQIFIVVFGGGAEGGGGWIGHSLALKADTPRTAAESYFLYIRDCDCIPAHKVFIASVRICII